MVKEISRAKGSPPVLPGGLGKQPLRSYIEKN